MSEFLTPEEQYNTQQRILHDAELIRGGAVINKLGILVVTAAQREELLYGDPEKEKMYEWLDTNVEQAFAEKAEGGKLSAIESRCVRALQRDGATTFRHVMIRGAYRVRDLRNIGGKSYDALIDIMQNDLGIPLNNTSTDEDLVKYCRNVAEIDGGFIDQKIRPGYSVQDVVDAESLEDIARMFNASFYVSDQVKLEAALSTKQQAVGFASSFEQLKHTQ